MLLFVDQPKSIKVLRLQEEGGAVKRVRLGGVQKGKLELGEELTAALSADEAGEVKSVIALYSASEDAQLKLDLARFPEIVRNVTNHMMAGKLDDIEHRLLATALTEAVRQLRKKERGAAQDVG